MTTFDKITDNIFIVFTIIYFLFVIFIVIINFEYWFKPKKYYRVEYYYDERYVSKAIFKAKTPKQAIDKLIRKYRRDFPLNEITDIISCTEVDFYKCLKEVSKND